MKTRFPEITEAVTMACSTPDGDVFVCLRTHEETAEIVSILQQNGISAFGTATAQEMLDRTKYNAPYLFLISEESSIVGDKHIAVRVREIEGHDEFDPGIIEVVAPDFDDIGFFHTRGVDLCLRQPLDVHDLLDWIRRIVPDVKEHRADNQDPNKRYVL